MKRLLGLVVALALAGCSNAPNETVTHGESSDPLSAVPPDPPTNAVTKLEPAEALDQAADAMAGVSDATYSGTATIRLDRGSHRFRTQWVLASGGTCQVTNSSRRLGEITTRQLKKASFDRYDRRAVVHLLGLPAYYAQDYARKWVRADRDLLGADACFPAGLVPGERFRSTFVARGLSEIRSQEVRRFDGRNAYGRVSLWIATADDPVVMRWRGAARGESRDLWLTGLDRGKELTRPPAGRTADLP